MSLWGTLHIQTTVVGSRIVNESDRQKYRYHEGKSVPEEVTTAVSTEELDTLQPDGLLSAPLGSLQPTLLALEDTKERHS